MTISIDMMVEELETERGAKQVRGFKITDDGKQELCREGQAWTSIEEPQGQYLS